MKVVIASFLLWNPININAFTPITYYSYHTAKQSPSSDLYMSSPEAANLLYLEQEKLLIKRGKFEQDLLSQSSTSIETPKIKVRGSGSAGGFGSASTQNNKQKFKAEGKAYAKILKQDGVVRIDNILTDSTTDALRDYVYQLRQSSEQDVASGKVKPIQRFADVLLKQDRCDLTIPLGDDIVSTALHEALLSSPVSSTISSVFSDKSILYEFSCLISDPGSQRQNLHPDTPYKDNVGPVLYTCFIALQDITLDMGPTTWLPQTHTQKAHAQFMDKDQKDHLIQSTPAVLGTLSKGSCAIFDSRCLHCGTSNQSNQSRALFYFSFRNPKVIYPGNPASIRAELKTAKLTMKDLVKDLELRQKGKGQPLMDSIADTMV